MEARIYKCIDGSCGVDRINVSLVIPNNILGITFDSNMKWDLQYDNAVKEANQNLYAISSLGGFV